MNKADVTINAVAAELKALEEKLARMKEQQLLPLIKALDNIDVVSGCVYSVHEVATSMTRNADAIVCALAPFCQKYEIHKSRRKAS